MPTNEELANKLKAANAELVEVKKSKEEVEASLTAKIADMGVPDIVDGDAGNGIKVYTPDEYAEMSAEQGRYMGRKLGTKTVCKTEELRALINSRWTPSMIMDKHGLDADDLKQLIWKLSKEELRDKPLKYSIPQDFFAREG